MSANDQEQHEIQISISAIRDREVLTDGVKARAAKDEADLYIAQRKTTGDPLTVVDMEDGASPYEDDKRLINNWNNLNLVQWDGDMVANAPRWVRHEYKLKTGEIMIVLSPIVDIDPKYVGTAVDETVGWLTDREDQGYPAGTPRAVLVVPDSWIGKWGVCFAGNGELGDETTMIVGERETTKSDPNGVRKGVRHEVIHIAARGDRKWFRGEADNAPRELLEGVDLLTEMLMASDMGTDKRVVESFLGYYANLLLSERVVDHIGGFAAESTYRSNGVDVQRSGAGLVVGEKVLNAHYFQGLVLSYIIFREYGGMESLRRVFNLASDKCQTEGVGDVERILVESLREGLGDPGGDINMEELMQKYQEMCGDILITQIDSESKGWVGVLSPEKKRQMLSMGGFRQEADGRMISED